MVCTKEKLLPFAVKEIETYISKVNQVFDDLSSVYTPLGPVYGTMTAHCATENLIQMRMKHYWVNPKLATIEPAKRKEQSIANMMDYDKTGFLFEPWTLDSNQRSQLHQLKAKLNQVLSTFRFKPENLRMPSGETSVSARGDVSLYAKLRDISQWSVTADCFDLACTVIYNVPGLKRSAKAHIGELSDEERTRLYFAYGDYSDVGFRVFRELLLEIVTIVDGSRIETVPKDNDTDRVISCEPMLNMIVQSVIEEGLRDVIKQHFGYDLDTLADAHKACVTDLALSTIDLKNASNSNWLSVIDWCYPHRVATLINKSRSPYGFHNEHRHTFNMVSPMGNGFTFGLMTLTLLCAGRVITDTVSVFGDDILIDQPSASLMIEFIRTLGFQVNESKTFITGSFRETCGGFSTHGQRITSFKFERAQNVVEANVLVNKVFILMMKNPLIYWLRELWRSLLKHVPAMLLEYGNVMSPEGRFVCVNTRNLLLRLRRASAVYETFRTQWLKKSHVKGFAHQNRYEIHELSPVVYVTLKAQSYKWKKAPSWNIKDHMLSYYLFQGRMGIPTVRTSQADVSQKVMYSSR